MHSCKGLKRVKSLNHCFILLSSFNLLTFLPNTRLNLNVMFSLTHSRSRLHGRGRGQRSQDMSSLKTESNFNLRQPPSRGQHSPQSEVKAQQRNSRCTKKQKGRLEMETDLFYIKTFGSGGAEAAGNHHSPFPSARRCRLSGTSSRRPRCSTTARPRG